MKYIIITISILITTACSDILALEKEDPANRGEVQEKVYFRTDGKYRSQTQINKNHVQGIWCEVKGYYCVGYNDDLYTFYYNNEQKNIIEPILSNLKVHYSNDSIYSVSEGMKFSHTIDYTLANDTTKIQYLYNTYANGRKRTFYRWIK